MTAFDDVFAANEEARALRHPQRSMRVTLECAHMRLMSANATAMGIGASTMCPICPDKPTRLVVNIEETGILDEEFFAMRRRTETST